MNDYSKFVNLLKRKYKLLFKRMKLKPVIWGNLKNTKPFSNIFGYDRGNQSIARYYVDQFIESKKEFITGKVLEIGDNIYTKGLGTNVVLSDILHVTEGNPKATIIADLTNADHLPSDFYDCVILTQTLNFIYDYHSALKHVHRIIKPNGKLIVTLSGISQISSYDMCRWGDYWRFTTLSTEKIFREFFNKDRIEVKSYGNVLAAISFMEGISSRELKKRELDFNDPNYQIIITVIAEK